MAAEAEDSPIDLDDEEPERPEITKFKRQLFACSSTLVAALSAGFLSQKLHERDAEYVNLLELDQSIINYSPMVGEIIGILIAVPSMFLLGRKKSLIISQTFSLIVLGAHEYYSLTLRLPDPTGLKEEFYCVVAQHACIRLTVFVMAIYVTEVAEPKFRAFFLGLFFVPFTMAVFVGRNVFSVTHLLNLALLVQLFAAGLALLAPETPYWLALKGRSLAAEQTFNHLTAGLGDPDDFEALLDGAINDSGSRNLINLSKQPFAAPFLKIFFMHLATEGVCQVFLARNKQPFEFFRYDIYYDHLQYVTGLLPQFIQGLLPQFIQHFFPITGSILFEVINFKVGRRTLFIGSIFATYVLYIFRFASFCSQKLYLSWIFDSICYLIGHMGGRPLLLLMPAEIFPTPMKEFGVAASDFIQIFLQISDYNNLEYTPTYHPYNLIRLTIVSLGLGLTYLYMPETKDLTLVDSQQLGIQFEHPGLHVLYNKEDEVGEADFL